MTTSQVDFHHRCMTCPSYQKIVDVAVHYTLKVKTTASWRLVCGMRKPWQRQGPMTKLKNQKNHSIGIGLSYWFRILSMIELISAIFTSPSPFTSPFSRGLPERIISMTAFMSAIFTSSSPFTSPTMPGTSFGFT